MTNLYKKIDNSLKKAPKRTISMYNNLISGVIGGAIIYYLILLGSLQNIILGFWYVIILWFLGFGIIIYVLKHLRSQNSKREEIKNYIWNSIMALLGGFFLSAIYLWDVNEIIAGIILIFLFIVISYGRSKTRR